MAVSSLKKTAIICNAVIFFATMLMALIGYKTRLYPSTTSEAAAKYPTDLDATENGLWYAIYAFQCCWILYTLTLVFRRDAEDIIPLRCYVLYSFARIVSVIWRIIWSRDLSTAAPFVLILVTASSLNFCLLFVMKSANDEKYKDGDNGQYNKFDVWCTRVFVPNAIVFYSMWQDMCTCFSLNRMLIYDAGASRSTAATISLTVLLALIVGWFIMENAFIEHYARFMILEYLVMIIASSLVLRAQWTDGTGYQAYVLAILVLSALFLILRLLIICLKEKKRLTGEDVNASTCFMKNR